MKSMDYFIKRPVLSSALSILILIVGFFSYFKLPLRLFPKIEVPIISVKTTYRGASADMMKSFVTSVVVNALNGIEGVNYITTSTAKGKSTTKVFMNMGYNADVALMNVMQKIASIRKQLPKEADDPIVEKSVEDDDPVMILAFTSSQMKKVQISDYLQRIIQPQFEAINGVATANVMGGQYVMRIWLQPDLMDAHHVSALDVMQAFNNQNVQSASGSTKGDEVGFNVTATSDLKTADEFNRVVVKHDKGNSVYLSDIGIANIGEANDKISAFYNGQPAIMMFVMTLPGVNPLSVVDKIQEQLPELSRRLPYDLKVHVAENVGTYIRSSIHEVIRTLLEATAIVVIVIFLFLGSLRAMIIPIVTIPLSLVGICFFIMLCGYSINMLTLLAMVLAIGLVVDDAIVVVENIFRHIEYGKTPMQAALIGGREIASPIISMTLTLAAVFAPIAFVGGLIGQLFSEFAFALAGSVVISGFIALTLSPMMCSRLLKPKLSSSRFIQGIDQIFEWIQMNYSTLLARAMSKRSIMLTIGVLSIIGCILLYGAVPKELAPKEDQGYIQVFGTAPAYTNSTFLANQTKELKKIVGSIPEVEQYVYINGIPAQNQVISFISLKPWGERKISTANFQPLIQEKLNQIPGLQTYAVMPSSLPGGQGMPIQFVVLGTGDYRQLYEVSDEIKNLAMKSGRFLFLKSDLTYDESVLQLDIDRNACETLGVSVQEVMSTLSLLLSGDKLQNFSMQGRVYDVIVKMPQIYRLNPNAIYNFHVRTSSGELIPLSSVVKLHTEIEPPLLNQFQKLNSVTLSGVPAPGYSLSESLDFLKEMAEQTLPKAMTYDYAGMSRQYMQEGNRMLITFAIAFIVIFIVLSIQFESYRDALVILLGSIPVSLLAALIPLKMGFATLNIYTEIGLLTLVGLVSKHGILMTRFAGELQDQGFSKFDAIQKASIIRLRPILMTTLAIVFGAIPLITANGAGSQSRFDIGIVIATGMLIGTLFTLFVVPVMYYYLASDRQKIREKREAAGWLGDLE